ncbi:hypothetical protein [Hymenobacter yonginensis]|uniref:Lipoprotein n=1 Tax=Hymenobacter yonginensis TaxID=748197 RepID=A0ABY7PV86_9BACT|nr:hypothetical protein [Hymenobacter yonginensis]WBO86843.1 hypothetical protein O9Z63_20385 [Hymenobacter yonginensis]
MPALHSFLTPATLLLLAGGWLLAGCSSPSSTAPPAADAAQTSNTPPPAFPFGGKVDSLNGIAGHAFGEPLSAFTDLRLLPPTPGVPVGPTQTYTYEGTKGWFGKHRAQVPSQLYTFLDGKFYAFMAIGDPTILRPEATYLLGPGQAQGAYQLFWEGAKARAVYAEKAVGFGREGRLDVLSKTMEAALAAKQQAQLKADNAQ